MLKIRCATDYSEYLYHWPLVQGATQFVNKWSKKNLKTFAEPCFRAFFVLLATSFPPCINPSVDGTLFHLINRNAQSATSLSVSQPNLQAAQKVSSSYGFVVTIMKHLGK